MGPIPKTIDEAVDRLMTALSIREKTEVAGLEREELHTLHQSLGVYIRSELSRWGRNPALLDEISKVPRKRPENCPAEYLDEATEIIAGALWDRLHREHVLRLVK